MNFVGYCFGAYRQVYGSGWTLAPLILHLDLLEDMVEVEQQRLADRQRLVVQTRSVLRSIQQDLVAGGFGSDYADAHRDISARFHNAKKGRLARLEECHADAQAMVDRMEDQFEPSADVGEEDPCPGLPDFLPALYRENQSDRFVRAVRRAMVDRSGPKGNTAAPERAINQTSHAASTR